MDLSDLDILLENQRKVENPDNIMEKVITKAYKNVMTKEIVQWEVQTESPNQYHRLRTIYTDIATREKQFQEWIKTQTDKPVSYKEAHSDAAEEEYLMLMGLEIAMEIDRHILIQLRNAARIVEFDKDFDKIVESLDFEPEWMVTSPEAIYLMESICKITGVNDGMNVNNDSSFSSKLSPRIYATRGNLKIYKDPLFPTSSMIFGRKDAYAYKPYVLAKPVKSIGHSSFDYRFDCYDSAKLNNNNVARCKYELP